MAEAAAEKVIALYEGGHRFKRDPYSEIVKLFSETPALSKAYACLVKYETDPERCIVELSKLIQPDVSSVPVTSRDTYQMLLRAVAVRDVSISSVDEKELGLVGDDPADSKDTNEMIVHRSVHEMASIATEMIKTSNTLRRRVDREKPAQWYNRVLVSEIGDNAVSRACNRAIRTSRTFEAMLATPELTSAIKNGVPADTRSGRAYLLQTRVIEDVLKLLDGNKAIRSELVDSVQVFSAKAVTKHVEFLARCVAEIKKYDKDFMADEQKRAISEFDGMATAINTYSGRKYHMGHPVAAGAAAAAAVGAGVSLPGRDRVWGGGGGGTGDGGWEKHLVLAPADSKDYYIRVTDIPEKWSEFVFMARLTPDYMTIRGNRKPAATAATVGDFSTMAELAASNTTTRVRLESIFHTDLPLVLQGIRGKVDDAFIKTHKKPRPGQAFPDVKYSFVKSQLVFIAQNNRAHQTARENAKALLAKLAKIPTTYTETELYKEHYAVYVVMHSIFMPRDVTVRGRVDTRYQEALFERVHIHMMTCVYRNKIIDCCILLLDQALGGGEMHLRKYYIDVWTKRARMAMNTQSSVEGAGEDAVFAIPSFLMCTAPTTTKVEHKDDIALLRVLNTLPAQDRLQACRVMICETFAAQAVIRERLHDINVLRVRYALTAKAKNTTEADVRKEIVSAQTIVFNTVTAMTRNSDVVLPTAAIRKEIEAECHKHSGNKDVVRPKSIASCGVRGMLLSAFLDMVNGLSRHDKEGRINEISQQRAWECVSIFNRTTSVLMWRGKDEKIDPIGEWIAKAGTGALQRSVDGKNGRSFFLSGTRATDLETLETKLWNEWFGIFSVRKFAAVRKL